MTNIWIVDSREHGSRLNTYLKRKLNQNFSSKEIAWAVEHNGCRINGQLERFCSKRLFAKDRVELVIAKKSQPEFEKGRILFEDEFFLAYDKPPFISSTGENSLESQIAFQAIHRLDRDTTGVILFAKTDEAHNAFCELFKKRKIKKSYLTIVLGIPKQERGVIENQVGIIKRRQGEVTWGVMPHQGGLPAKTEWSIEKAGSDLTLLKCLLHTGRTHQIRVHLSHIGHPILGDAHYGTRKKHNAPQVFRPLLHAAQVEFKHPFTKESVVIEAPLPEDFLKIAATL